MKTPAARSVGVFFFMDIWNILINLNMKYLVVDGGLSGTGIRDKYDGGYINPADLGLNPEITAHIGHGSQNMKTNTLPDLRTKITL